MITYVIYCHPTDYPCEYVARCWRVAPAGPVPDELPFARAMTLNDVRQALPPGLHNIGRYEEDDPKIVEVWI